MSTDKQEHVAWCRYLQGRIFLCDSDQQGAFKVYRAALVERDVLRGEIAQREAEVLVLWEARDTLRAENVRLREALQWIADFANKNYEQDTKLVAQSARTLIRISDKASAALESRCR